MRTNEAYLQNLYPREAGQAAILVVLMLGTFLLGALAFAVDFSNMWFHRQSAQTAADAACLAGATDLLFTAGGGAVPTGAHFTTSAGSDCASSSTAVMCKYAGFNGYNGTGFTATTAGNTVAWTFPGLGTVAGATDPPTSLSVAHPYLKVAVTENVQTWFASLLGRGYQQVGATCTCGVQSVKSAPPLLILDPSVAASLQMTPGSSIAIVGGPSRSIQVDSQSSGAQTQAGTIDLSLGGPGTPHGTGSDVGIVGSESPLAATFNPGTTGHYDSPSLPISDPYGSVPAPTLAGAKDPTPNPVPQHDAMYNCPDPSGCTVYSPGHYTKNINVGSGTALFINGLYYMDANLDASGTGATLRNAYRNDKTTSQLDGVVFYFNTGIPKITGSSTSYAAADWMPSKLMQCDATAALPYGVPATLNGTALWAPCTANGTYWQSPSTDTLATSATASTATRGMLFYYGHANKANPGPDITGGGQLAFAGALYFHLDPANGSVQLKLAGGAGSGTEILGQIVVDQLKTAGNGVITMALNSKKISNILKVAMLE